MPANQSTFVPPDCITAPIGVATHGRLAFVRGASLVTLTADPALLTLFQARFEGPEPQVQAADGAVTIRYRRLSLAEWARYALLWGQHASTIALNARLPWQISIQGGVAKLGADLRALRLSALVVSGGASEVAIELPPPAGVVAIRIAGGANRVTLRRPAHSAAQVLVHGGASQIAFDEQSFGAIGGAVRLASPGAAHAADRYEIEIAGGASNLTIDRW